MDKILVAEDSIIVNQHIRKTLEGSGFEVHSAFTGKEAVSLADEHHPSLVLMDIMMETKADGIEAANTIKETLDLPVIFLTALTDTDTIEKVKDSQPYGYIVKPFNEVELLSNIQVALHKSKAENEVKNNRDLFQASINSIDEAFILLDENKRIFYTNHKAEHLLGARFKEVFEREADDVLRFYAKDSDRSINFSQLSELRPEQLRILEIRYKNKEKEVAIGDLLVREVLLKKKQFSLFLFKDIADRIRVRALEQEIERSKITSLIEGQENERNRLSRDLHDGIGQLINLIKLKVKTLPDSNAKEELIPLLDQTVEEVRNITEDLHPTRLNDFTIETCIEKLVEQFEKDGGIDFKFIHKDVPPFDRITKTHVYRIAQEAISNIVKHSGAKSATLQLFGMEDKIQMTIEDDGQGFDPSNIDTGHTHHGLQNIQYRVDSLGGLLSVESSPVSGTLIVITLPYPDGHQTVFN